MQTSDENKGWLEQEAPFLNEIGMVILKLKRIVDLVHQFSKLKRLLRDKSAILSYLLFAVGNFLEAYSRFQKNFFRTRFPYKKWLISVDFQVQMYRPCT